MKIGNHCIHSGSCRYVSVGLEADNVVDLDTELCLTTETGEGVVTDNTAGIVGTVIGVWISPMEWNHCIHGGVGTYVSV